MPWLTQELIARGLQWEKVCDTEDKLRAAGLHTKKNVIAVSSSRWSDAYLKTIGITDPLVCRAVQNMRLQCTWLGARLTAHGVTNSALAACEFAVFHTIGCSTEVSFAQVLPDELCDLYLMRMRIESGFVRRCIRAVHEQVRAEHNMPPVASTTSTTSTSTSSATVVLPCPMAQGTTEALQMCDAGPLQRRADAPPPQEVGNWEHL